MRLFPPLPVATCAHTRHGHTDKYEWMIDEELEFITTIQIIIKCKNTERASYGHEQLQK